MEYGVEEPGNQTHAVCSRQDAFAAVGDLCVGYAE
jgi:hypothetical protein